MNPTPYREPDDMFVLPVTAGRLPGCPPCCSHDCGSVHCPSHCKSPVDKITWSKCPGIDMPAVKPRSRHARAALTAVMMLVGIPGAAIGLMTRADREAPIVGSVEDLAACAVTAIAGVPIPAPPPSGGVLLWNVDGGVSWVPVGSDVSAPSTKGH